MTRICIRHARVVLPDRVLRDHAVLLVDGMIVTVAPSAQLEDVQVDHCIDAEDRLLGPGFVDIHCHGGNGHWVFEEPEKAAVAQLRHGTTRMLGTTILLPTHAENVEAVRTVADAINSGRVPSVAGIHMEGPYINPDFGAYREYAYDPQPEEYHQFVTAADGCLRAMTIAPELPGMARMVHDLQVATSGRIVFSVGHGRASREQVVPLIPSGLRLMTHMFNATGTAIEPSRYGGTLEASLDTIVLTEPGIVAELIVDRLGRHVRPELLQLAVRAKGIDGLVLVTDATAADGTPPPDGMDDGLPPDVNFNTAGGLAGSALTMDGALGNIMKHTGIDLVDAWRMASFNPARVHGWLAETGWIAPGRRGDLVLCDIDDNHTVHVHDVWLAGRKVEEQ